MRIGTVVATRELVDNRLVQVFVDAATQLWFPASDVRPVPDTGFAVVSRDEFLARLLLEKERRPMADVLYSYRGSRTQFEVYQFKPVFKFLGSDRRRLLIADEVGLGKTIEAALIYLELKARSDLPRVLILCPSGLREKWRSELKLRFDEDFSVLDSRQLARFLRDYDGTGGLERLKAIASIETIRRQDFQEQFVAYGLTLDLLVVDEAHHARNAATETHRSIRVLADRSDNVLLLTATPIQTRDSDLFTMLQLVDPGAFEDAATFAAHLAPNGLVNAAVRALAHGAPARALEHLRVLGSLPGMAGNPILGAAIARLLDGRPLPLDEATRLRRDLLELNSLSYVFTRTRKRDVKAVAQRSSATVTVRLRPEEQAFYEAMLGYVRRRVLAEGRGVAPFLMVTRERQAASCLAATRRYLEETLRTRRDAIQYEGSSTALDENGDDGARPVANLHELAELAALSHHIGDRDSKFDELQVLLRQLLRESGASKVLVFSFFRRTIQYLHERLRDMGFAVFVVHGGISPEQRQLAMSRFAASERPAVLLSSEVGAEGLDFQFCDTLVNYDLPWNPMRIEQRIGRIDRYGQQSPKIRVINFVIADSVEERILTRLYDRIRLFEESIGDLEPILGVEVQKLTSMVLSRHLTPAEQTRLAEDTAKRIEFLRAEQEDFEARQAELMAHDALFQGDVEEAVATGRVVSGEEVAAVVRTWFAHAFPASRLEDAGDVWLLRADPRLRAAFNEFLASWPEKSERATNLLRLMQNAHGVPCTFSDVLANQRRNLEFIHVRHPLVRAAVDHLRRRSQQEPVSDHPVVRLAAITPDVAGDFVMFLNAIHIRALTDQIRFVPLVYELDGRPRPDVAKRALRLILEAREDAQRVVDLELYQRLYTAQHAAMAAERQRVERLVRERNDAMVDTRAASARRTYAAKIRKREEWLVEAADSRIRRMRSGEITHLRAQLDERLREIESKRNVAVSYELLMGGFLRLERDGSEEDPALDGTDRATSASDRVRPRRVRAQANRRPRSNRPAATPASPDRASEHAPGLIPGDANDQPRTPPPAAPEVSPSSPAARGHGARPAESLLRRLVRRIRGDG